VLDEFPDAAVTEIDDGWEDRWREFHRSVRIGRLWIGPPWEVPPPDAVAVVIDPGRAFGTGAHPSTRLSLELLLDERRGSLLDIGCGSGVIAIAAAKLGFEPVTALDVDPVAVEVALGNAAANGVELAATTLADARGAEALPAADLAVSNISLEAIEAVAPLITSPRWITAGYLARDLPELYPFRHAGRSEVDGWAADLFVR
jgi:ribosomal protein L11 methyltransferase